MSYFPIHFEEGYFDNDHYSVEQIERLAAEKIIQSFELKFDNALNKAKQQNSQIDANKLAQEAIRSVIVKKIDELWQEHLLSMDHLRSEVSLRTVGQRDPLLEFKHEAFRLFHDLTHRLHSEAARNLFKIELTLYHPGLFQDLLTQINLETNRLIFDGMPDLQQTSEETSSRQPPIEEREIPQQLPVTATPKVGRNDPCPCQSGKKYKKCCGVSEEPAPAI